jgi:hypothetical protein
MAGPEVIREDRMMKFLEYGGLSLVQQISSGFFLTTSRSVLATLGNSLCSDEKSLPGRQKRA